NIIYRPNDEIYNGLRSEPNASCFAQFWVVFTQESFVKMDGGVFHFGGFPVGFQNFFHITSQENIHQTIYNPFNPVVNVRSGNVAKQFSQKRTRFRNEFSCFLSAKGWQSRVVQTSGKHSVSNGLSINVCKTLWGDVVNQNLFKS